jgi:hypothetical protein
MATLPRLETISAVKALKELQKTSQGCQNVIIPLNMG